MIEKIDIPFVLSDAMKKLAKKRRVELGMVYEEAIENYLKTKKDK